MRPQRWSRCKACLGAVIGVEREIAGKLAGLRTHVFACAGSALMMILGQGIIDQIQQRETAPILCIDPIRLLQAIVVGISFLGAGTIIHDRDAGVQGLTTAAAIKNGIDWGWPCFAFPASSTPLAKATHDLNNRLKSLEISGLQTKLTRLANHNARQL